MSIATRSKNRRYGRHATVTKQLPPNPEDTPDQLSHLQSVSQTAIDYYLENKEEIAIENIIPETSGLFVGRVTLGTMKKAHKASL